MNKYLILILVMFLMSCSITNNKPTIKAEIYKYGIYESKANGLVLANQAIPSGKIILDSEDKYVKETNKIPLRLNVSFGYDFKISGLKEKNITLHCVIKHPPIHKPDGTVSTLTEYDYSYEVENGKLDYGAYYTMNHDYEMVEGTWIRSYYYKGKLLISKKFFISKKYVE